MELAPEGVIVTPASLWYPLWALHVSETRTVPMAGMFRWHTYNAQIIAKSRTATDPFPDGVLT